MTITEEKILEDLKSKGIRVYGKRIVSSFKTTDSAERMARINFLVEKCGYTLHDEKGFPKKPEKKPEAAPSVAV